MASKCEMEIEREITKLTFFRINIEETIALVEEEIFILRQLLKRFRYLYKEVKKFYDRKGVYALKNPKFREKLYLLLHIGKIIMELTEVSPFVDKETLKPNNRKRKLLKRLSDSSF
jgi:hypothetical protein